MNVIDFNNANCKHCYKCVRNCSVKAISVINEQAHIIKEACILCGHCLEICPQNAKTFASDIERVKEYIRKGDRVIISIAPSYVGVLDFDQPGQIVDALQKLGFYEVRETAEGAALVTREYQRLLREGTMENMITTCCPSVNEMIEKYYPSLTKYMLPVVSPMIAHGRLIRKLYGDDIKVVFLGPCVAKKEEAVGDARVFGAIDAILTFEEIEQWFAMEGIDVHKCEDKPMANPPVNVNGLYPISGGVVQSVLAEYKMENYSRLYVDGIDECRELFESMEEGDLSRCFIEANMCKGGCIKGPASNNKNKSFVKARVKVEKQVEDRTPASLVIRTLNVPLQKKFYNKQRLEKMPTEAELLDILHSMGKIKPSDELNCSACGYPTCRDKAIAVYQGKAELDMCLPYAVAKAESMSNVVLDITPNLILIVDKNLRLKECNKSAQIFFGVSREDALKSYIFEYIETQDIEQVLQTREPILDKKVNLPQIQLVAEEKIVYIDELDSVLVIYEDVRKREKAKEKRMQLKMETIEMAQKVIDKQMMVAQEIAGLLGETTAETKVTLTKLRDSILDDEGEDE